MLPRFSTSCLRAATLKQAWHKPPPPSLLRTLYTKPTSTYTPPFTPLRIITPKRVFTTTIPVQNMANKKIPTVGGSEVAKDRNATDWAIIRQLMKYIWPKNDVSVKTRVVIALSLLVGGKVSIFTLI